MKIAKTLLKVRLKELFRISNKTKVFGGSEVNSGLMAKYEACYKLHNYPTLRFSAIAFEQVSLDTLTDQELFWLLEQFSPAEIEKYYTEKEIKQYSELKWEENNDVIEIPCVEVVKGEQWIGAIANAPEFFKKLRDEQKIYYNPNAQRPMTVEHTKNGKLYWKITLIKRVYQQIRESFKSKRFIPNTITLNIDPDTDTKLEYDEDTRTLYISDLTFFDITDGFHRYKAICEEKDENTDFSYPMEIRITRFYDNKAAYFVWQEMQKAPVKKKDAASLNTETVEYKIVNRLNESEGYLQDKIGRNDSEIPVTEMISAVKKFYVKPMEKSKIPYDKTNFIKEVTKEINRNWTAFDEEYPDFFARKLNGKEIEAFIECTKKNVSIEDTYNALNAVREGCQLIVTDNPPTDEE